MVCVPCARGCHTQADLHLGAMEGDPLTSCRLGDPGAAMPCPRPQKGPPQTPVVTPVPCVSLWGPAFQDAACVPLLP